MGTNWPPAESVANLTSVTPPDDELIWEVLDTVSLNKTTRSLCVYHCKLRYHTTSLMLTCVQPVTGNCLILICSISIAIKFLYSLF